MQASLSQSAQSFVNASVQRASGSKTALPDSEYAIQIAAQTYENSVNKVAGTKQGDIKRLAQELSSNISKSGWWVLGAWYQTFAQANTKLSDAMAAKATVFGMSTSGDPSVVSVYDEAYALSLIHI